MSASVAEAADRLDAVLKSAVPRLADIDDEDAARRPAPDRWAPQEILGHLIDSASNNHQRFVRGQLAASVELPRYEQESWVATQRYIDASWPELVDLWLLFNRHLLRIMRSVKESSLDTPIAIGGREAVPLRLVMIDYVLHLEHHLAQIFGEGGGRKFESPVF